MPSISPQQLLDNPHLLLRNSVCVGDGRSNGYSGKVGAICKNGQHFIVSPNMDYVPMPAANNRVSIKMNGRQGDDDPLQWPQLFHEYNSHWTTIPRPPQCLDSGNSSQRILHMHYSPDFFVPITNITVSGLGHLRGDIVKLMKSWLESYRASCQQVAENASLSKTPLMSRLAQSVAQGVEHLENLPMSHNQTHYMFREYQHNMLEGEALIQYLTVYQPRMQRDPPDLARANCPPHNIMGAFFTNPVHAHTYWKGAIPVWLILPASSASLYNVEKIVELTPSTGMIVMDDHPAHKGVHFEGDANSDSLGCYNFFLEYTRHYLSGSNPFRRSKNVSLITLDTPASSDPTPPSRHSSLPSGPIRTTKHCPFKGKQPYTQKQAAAPAGSAGRDKYTDVCHPLLPECWPAWSLALSSVDQNPGNRVSDYLEEPKGYALPDPLLFISPVKDEKKAVYFANWLLHRPALLYRVTAPCKASNPISSQLWRTLLGGNTKETSTQEPSTSSTKSVQRQTTVVQILSDCIADSDEVAAKYIDDGHVNWREHVLTIGKLPSTNVAREVLWEIAEVNFRIEFLALDQRANINLEEEEHLRKEKIGQCFPQGFVAFAPQMFESKRGLVAESWQERQPFIIALANVLCSWNGFKDFMKQKGCFLFQEMPLCSERMNESETLAAESFLVSFYLQSFFNYFGRPAVIPRHL